MRSEDLVWLGLWLQAALYCTHGWGGIWPNVQTNKVYFLGWVGLGGLRVMDQWSPFLKKCYLQFFIFHFPFAICRLPLLQACLKGEFTSWLGAAVFKNCMKENYNLIRTPGNLTAKQARLVLSTTRWYLFWHAERTYRLACSLLRCDISFIEISQNLGRAFLCI